MEQVELFNAEVHRSSNNVAMGSHLPVVTVHNKAVSKHCLQLHNSTGRPPRANVALLLDRFTSVFHGIPSKWYIRIRKWAAFRRPYPIRCVRGLGFLILTLFHSSLLTVKSK